MKTTATSPVEGDLQAFERSLSQCLRKDRFALRRRIDRLLDLQRRGTDCAEALAALGEDLGRSV